MKLNRIRATGLQNGDFDYQLSPFAVFIGDNESGKTRVLNAATVLLLGYVPKLGKQPKATFKLSNGVEMTIEGWLDDGRKISRRFWLAGSTVKSESDVPEEIAKYDGMATMLDANEYFALTDTPRMQYIASHCAVSTKLNRLGIIDRLKAKIEDGAEEIDSLNGSVIGREDPVSAWIELFITRVADEWKLTKASAQRAEKTIQQLTDMRLKDEPTTPLSALESKRAGLLAELAQLNEKKGGVIGKFSQMKNDAQRRASINRELASGEKTRAALVDARQQLATLAEQIAAEEPVTDDMIRAASDKLEELSHQRIEATRLKDEAKKRRDLLEKQLSELDGRDECPYCGAKGDGWKAFKAAELATEIDTAKAEEEKQAALVPELLKQVNAARDAQLVKLQQQRNQGDMRVQKSQMETKVAQLEGQVRQLDALLAEQGRLMADDPQVTTQVELIQTEINVKNGDIREVDQEITRVNGRAFELKRLADAEKERDDAKVKAKIQEQVGKELRVIQSEMVADAFKPLLETANRIFGPLFRTPLAYHDGTIGTWRDGVWVSHVTFSGSQQLMTYCAIQAALSASSPIKLFLTDELKDIHSSRLSLFIDCVKKAIERGEIDSVLAAEPERGEIYRAHADSVLQVVEV